MAGDGPLDILTELTAYTGRMQELPAWVDNGVILGLEDGTQAVEHAVAQALQAQIPLSGVWLPDWTGTRNASFGKRLWWNWELDDRQYPHWSEMVQGLRKRGIR